MTTYTLYGNPTSGPVYKVALALSLLGKPYAFRFVDFAARQHKSPDYLKINRYGQIPALAVAGGPTLVQSGAILDYLAEREGRFSGSDAAERQEIREWLLWDADRLSPGIYRSRAVALGRLTLEPAVAAYFREAGEAGLAVLDETLAQRDWLVGDAPSIADIAVYGVIGLAPQGNYDLTRWPAVNAFRARVEALPGWRPQSELTFSRDRD